MSGGVGFPDILSHMRMSRAQAEVKRSFDAAQIELVTGEAADRVRATGGDPSRLLAMERSIATLDSRTPLLSMAQSRAAATQGALETVHEATETMGVQLLQDVEGIGLSAARSTAESAKAALSQVLSALNTELSGRHLFAGARTGAPMPDAETVISDIRDIISFSVKQMTPDAALGDLSPYQDYQANRAAPPDDPPKTLHDVIMDNIDLYFTRGEDLILDEGYQPLGPKPPEPQPDDPLYPESAEDPAYIAALEAWNTTGVGDEPQPDDPKYPGGDTDPDYLDDLDDWNALDHPVETYPTPRTTTHDDTIELDETLTRSFDLRFAGGEDPPDTPPVELADGEHMAYAIRGDHDDLRAMIKGLATAAAAVETYGKPEDASRLFDMLEDAGKTMMTATDALTKLRSGLGLAEQRIEEAQVRTAAQRSTLELARSGLIGRDQYETATRISELENQLQMIYAITARTSQLSLLNFIR